MTLLIKSENDNIIKCCLKGLNGKVYLKNKIYLFNLFIDFQFKIYNLNINCMRCSELRLQ